MIKNISLLFFILFFLLNLSCSIAPIEASGADGKTGSLKLPPGFTPPAAKKLTHSGGGIVVDMYARDFSQGNLVYCEVYAAESKELELKSAVYGKMSLALTKKTWGYRTFLPIGPEAEPGKKTIVFSYIIDGKTLTETVVFTAAKTDFPVSRTPLDLGKYSNQGSEAKPEIVAFIKESKKKKDEAFASRENDLIGSSFSHPRDLHYITSQFWSKRIYQRYKIENKKRIRLKDTEKIHRGTDLRGETGTPAFAMADGKVVLADLLYYEGNMVVIDHGNKLFSYYMHMSALKVKKGDMVKAGDQIGAVGSTGLSTAAHLHVSMILNWIELDPLSLLSLPVRN
ncbi:MAG: M23 family metallopeptidase [Spirochaetia bacterium]|jgi:murein DD-endopeptidase MepM/ murein hydrolase activator NlpD|nr:M23 family metallopeptidase [Spirochaetia bacterium]